jgi:hypothetical protein
LTDAETVVPAIGVHDAIVQFAGQRSRIVQVHPDTPDGQAAFEGCSTHEPCSPPQSASLPHAVPGSATVVISRVFPSSQVSGGSTTPFPHTGPLGIEVLLVVDEVVVTLVDVVGLGTVLDDEVLVLVETVVVVDEVVVVEEVVVGRANVVLVTEVVVG